MAGARRVVVHEDDIGMCHGANVAFRELTRLGICTSGAVMVPCPWFLEIAEMQARDPRLDIGVHLVLTSEWKTYRWRPLTSASRASGLVDGDGYFWRRPQEARAHAHPEAGEAELRAQVALFGARLSANASRRAGWRSPVCARSATKCAEPKPRRREVEPSQPLEITRADRSTSSPLRREPLKSARP